MNIVYFKELLEVLSSVGIDTCRIMPIEHEGQPANIMQAMDSRGNVIVYDVLGELVTEKAMGIQSVRGLLSRINLFDIEKVSVTIKVNERHDIAEEINMKEGRRKASFRFSRPQAIVAVGEMDEFDRSPLIEFKKEYVDYLKKAISSIMMTGDKEHSYIALEAKDDELTMKVYDGENDSFVETLTIDGLGTIDKCQWEVDSFTRVLKTALQGDESTVVFEVTEMGAAVFDMEVFEVMVAPIAI